MIHDRISRRRVLAAAGGVGIAAVSVWARPWRSLVAFVPVSAAERLVGLFSHRASAEAVGLPRISLASRARLRSAISWI